MRPKNDSIRNYLKSNNKCYFKKDTKDNTTTTTK